MLFSVSASDDLTSHPPNGKTTVGGGACPEEPPLALPEPTPAEELPFDPRFGAHGLTIRAIAGRESGLTHGGDLLPKLLASISSRTVAFHRHIAIARLRSQASRRRHAAVSTVAVHDDW